VQVVTFRGGRTAALMGRVPEAGDDDRTYLSRPGSFVLLDLGLLVGKQSTTGSACAAIRGSRRWPLNRHWPLEHPQVRDEGSVGLPTACQVKNEYR
jgi:hypothetical protein